MRNSLSSFTEAELEALFVHIQQGAAIHIDLVEMGHKKPTTPVVMDNIEGNERSYQHIQVNGGLSVGESNLEGQCRKANL